MTKEISIEPKGLIGLAGYKGAGKTYVAKQIMADHPMSLRVAFADPLKAMISTLLDQMDWADNDIARALYGDLKDTPFSTLWGLTPRHLMVTLGTEWGRNLIDPNMWVDVTMSKIIEFRYQGVAVVVDDVRFESEATAIRKAGGKVILVQRPGVERKSDHISEKLPPYDDIYDNWEKPDEES